MLSYIGRRLLLAIPTVLGVATIIFLLVRLLPGDPARVIAGVNATDADVEKLRHQLELDRPVLEQYVLFISRLLRGDLGTSARTGAPVSAEILSRLPNSLELAVIGLLIATILGLLAGVLASMRRNSIADLVISLVSIFGYSMPVFWLGLMLIILVAIVLHVPLPIAGNTTPLSWVLPATTLAFFSTALIARQTRSAMLEQLGLDYVRTAVAKGLPRRIVVVRHTLRNALLPVITVLGLQFGGLLGSAVVTETIYSWPGVGRLLIDSIAARDYPVVQGCVLLLAVTFICVNLLVDLIYAFVDPRIRYR